MLTLGIDIGSRNSKIVLFDSETWQFIDYAYASTDSSPLVSVDRLLNDVLSRSDVTLSRIDARVVTGYGRKLYQQEARTMSEISCHAAGVVYYYPQCRTIIDIGGQDSKIITLDGHGKVLDFAMNDKCAAGTGRFLEMTAMRLDCPVSGISGLAAKATKERDLNSTCVVFAESEIIGLMAQNVIPADIARAVHNSIARRVVAQMTALEFGSPIVFTGGVAQNADLCFCLGRALGQDIHSPPEPEITGALGAAILAIVK